RPYCCLYVSRRDSRRYVLSHEDVLREYGSLIVHDSRMDSVFSAALGDQGYVLRHPQLEPLIAAAERIQEHPD
ncbi:MAG: carboxylate--amine ligase, partial [Chloroflexota bacterium]|nr:carboxylate--amine ligase [Chloroflexota bacterium]